MRLTRRRTADDLSAMYRNGTLPRKDDAIPIPSKAGILLGTGPDLQRPRKPSESSDGYRDDQKYLINNDFMRRTTHGSRSKTNRPTPVDTYQPTSRKSRSRDGSFNAGNDAPRRGSAPNNSTSGPEYYCHDSPTLPSYDRDLVAQIAAEDHERRRRAHMMRTMPRQTTKTPEFWTQDEARDKPTPLLSSTEKKSRKLSTLFPQPKATLSRMFMPQRWSQSPTTPTTPLSPDSPLDDFSGETIFVQLKRPAGSKRYEAYKTYKSPPSTTSSRYSSLNALGSDTQDTVKTPLRRASQSMKHWFDGLDASESDENEQSTPPANETMVPKATSSAETADLWETVRSLPPKKSRRFSKNPVEDNLMAIEFAREQMQERQKLIQQRRESMASGAMNRTKSTSVTPEPKAIGLGREHQRLNPAEQRDQRRASDDSVAVDSATSMPASVEHSKMEEAKPAELRYADPNVSILSLSSSTDEDEDDAPASHSTQELPLRSVTSPTPVATRVPAGLPARASVASPTPTDETTSAEHVDKALRKLNSEESPSSQRSKARESMELKARNSRRSMSGDVPATPQHESRHMMSVTEDEMILLEMIRHKRATMQRESMADGLDSMLKSPSERMMEQARLAEEIASENLPGQNHERKTSNTRIETVPEEKEDEELAEKEEREENLDSGVDMQQSSTDDIALEDSFPQPPVQSPRSVKSGEGKPRPELMKPFTYAPTGRPTRPRSTSAGSITDAQSAANKDDDSEDNWRALIGGGPEALFPRPPSSIKSPVEPMGRQRLSTLSPVPSSTAVRLSLRIPNRRSIRPMETIESSPPRRTIISGQRLSKTMDRQPSLRKTVSAFPLRPSPATNVIDAEQALQLFPPRTFLCSPDQSPAKSPPPGSEPHAISTQDSPVNKRQSILAIRQALPSMDEALAEKSIKRASLTTPTKEAISATDEVMDALVELGGARPRTPGYFCESHDTNNDV